MPFFVSFPFFCPMVFPCFFLRCVGWSYSSKYFCRVFWEDDVCVFEGVILEENPPKIIKSCKSWINYLLLVGFSVFGKIGDRTPIFDLSTYPDSFIRRWGGGELFIEISKIRWYQGKNGHRKIQAKSWESGKKKVVSKNQNIVSNHFLGTFGTIIFSGPHFTHPPTYLAPLEHRLLLGILVHVTWYWRGRNVPGQKKTTNSELIKSGGPKKKFLSQNHLKTHSGQFLDTFGKKIFFSTPHFAFAKKSLPK